jgi:hypothetical protein
MPPLDVRNYREGAAEYIALAYAQGSTLTELSQLHPEFIPPLLFIRRWRKERPEFDELMREAELARAEQLVDETVRISDDQGRSAAKAANAIRTRLKLGALLDRERYSERQTLDINTRKLQSPDDLALLTDDQLQALLLKHGSIDGQAVRVLDEEEDREGGHPP